MSESHYYLCSLRAGCQDLVFWNNRKSFQHNPRNRELRASDWSVQLHQGLWLAVVHPTYSECGDSWSGCQAQRREAPQSSLISLNLTWTGSNSGPGSWEQGGNLDESRVMDQSEASICVTWSILTNEKPVFRSLMNRWSLSYSLKDSFGKKSDKNHWSLLVARNWWTFNQAASRTHDKVADSRDWGIGTKWDSLHPGPNKD